MKKLSVRFLMLISAVLLSVSLASCAIMPTEGGAFTTKPVEAHEPIKYDCVMALERFEDFKPVVDDLEFKAKNVTVTDYGDKWVADTGEGVVTSPKLYAGLTGRIDGNISLFNGERYYRVNKPKVNFSYSNVNKKGKGVGKTFFNCSKIENVD